MHLRKYIPTLAALISVALLNLDIADSARGPQSDTRSRLIEQVRKSRRAEFQIRHQTELLSTAILPELPANGPILSSNSVPPSPGLNVGVTYLDMQSPHSLGKQIARNPSSDYVHMVWSTIQAFDPGGDWDTHEVMYVAYKHSTTSLVPGYGGGVISLDPLTIGQYANLDVGKDNMAFPVFSQREDVSFPRVPFAAWVANPNSPGGNDYGCYPPTLCGDVLPARIATQRTASEFDTRHVIGHGTAGCGPVLYYWRYDSLNWSAPAIIDTVFGGSAVIAADDNSHKVAIVFHDIDEPGMGGANNVFYYESLTRGGGWLNGSELGASFKNTLSNYTDTASGAQAWMNIDAAYDHAGTLHIVWDEQPLANKTNDAILRHWNNSRNTIRPIVIASWANPSLTMRLNVTGISLGIGDGATSCNGEANSDYLYVLYTQFAGASTEAQADVAGASGSPTHPNGELYLTVSNDGGSGWSSPVNLTNTKTPNCRPAAGPDSVCRSEDWATLNRDVSDIDILYISDRDAGSAVHGIGSYQPNEVMYLRIPGGGVNPDVICPPVSAGFAATLTYDAECEYNAQPGEIKSDETLTVSNLGNASLSGTIGVLPGAPWLTIPGAGAYTIPQGGADLNYGLVMDATTLSEGLYTATVRITHNDSTKPNPHDIVINFFVISDFRCPQGAVISTGVE